jgi:hypothetical protein
MNPKPYVIDTHQPTEGPWHVTSWGNRYASVTLADGRKFALGVERNKVVRIPYKPRGQNRGWTWNGYVMDANGHTVASGKVSGTIGVRGLLQMAGLI